MGDGVARGFGGASVFGAGGGAFAAEGCHGGEVCVCVYEKVVLVRMGGCNIWRFLRHESGWEPRLDGGVPRWGLHPTSSRPHIEISC